MTVPRVYAEYLRRANAAFVKAGHRSLFDLSKRPLPEGEDEEAEISAAEADAILKACGLGTWPPEREVVR